MQEQGKSIKQKNYAKLRKAKGLSREDVASKLRVSSMTIYRWETGKVTPHPILKRELEKILTSQEKELAQV